MVKRKKLDRKRLSTLFTVLMIMFMMVSSVFTSKLIVAEDTETDVVPTEVTEVTENEPTEETEETLSLKEHLKSDSYVQIGYTRVELGEVSEEYNEFGFVKTDETEFVLLLSLEIDENDENEYTYTLPEGVVFNAENIKTSDDLQATLQGNVLTVKRIQKNDTPTEELENTTNNDETPVVNNEETTSENITTNETQNENLDNSEVSNEETTLENNEQTTEGTNTESNKTTQEANNEETPVVNNEEKTNENTTNNETLVAGASFDEPEYTTYVEIVGTLLEEAETINVEGFGTFNTMMPMMLFRGPNRAPGNCVVDPENTLDTINVSEHLIAKSDQNSAGVYAWIKLNGKTFTLNDHLHDNPEFIEEVDKLPESLADGSKNVEVYLSWRIDPASLEGTITKDTKFVYTLPDGIHWDPEDVDLVDLKNPNGSAAGKFQVNGRQIVATYSQRFIDRVYGSCSSFTSYGTIEGSATMSDWDDVGNEPYHFEGIGYFEPQTEEAIARIRTEKSIVRDTISYLGNGKYSVQYKTTITGNYKKDGTPGQLRNVNVLDTFDNSMSLPSNPAYTLMSGSVDVNDRFVNPSKCTANTNGKGFACEISYIDDGETLSLTYYLIVDLNYTEEDPAPSPLSSATRSFENDVEVTAPNPNDPTSPLKDTSFVIDTYSMKNPQKAGVPYPFAPEQALWEIKYNAGNFQKASSIKPKEQEFPGINLGGMFVSDKMGEGQKYVEGTFKVETSTDGENWTDITSQITDLSWEDKDQDVEQIKEYFSFTIPENIYDLIRVTYRAESTNQNTSVLLTNTASIASDEKGTDEKTGDGEAPLIGPSNLPKIKKSGDEYGPDGNFEWKIEIDIYKEMNRNVRVYDAMEQGLILYPSTIKVERVKIVDGEEVTEEVTGWLFEGSSEGTNTYNRKPKEGDDLSGNPPWVAADLADSKHNWYIVLTSENGLLPVDGYEFKTNQESGQKETTDDYAKYRITYQTNAPLPELDENGNPQSKKYLNEAQVRAKSEDTSDTEDRYNMSQAELEKKYIEKESNDSVYETVTGDKVDTTHGYIGWFIRIYPLDTNGYVEIEDKFSYSTNQTSMKLDNDSVHVYVSTNKQRPTSDEEIAPNLYTISNSSTSGFTLRINSAPRAGITKSKYIYVFYQTRVDPRVNNRSIRYTNTANLNRNGDKLYPPATAYTTRNDIVISKTSKRNGPYVTYTMKINQELFDIDPAKGTLTIEDTRGASIEYIEGSMHFYDGSKYKASDSAEAKAEYEFTGSPYTVTSNGRTIDIIIPDETYIVIEYQAYITKIDGDLSGEDAVNRAVIKGIRGFEVENHLRGKVQKARAGTSIDTDHPWIKIMKADSRNLRALQGAVFKFTAYDVDPTTGELTPKDGEVYEVETDENGTIWFTFDHEKEWMTYYDVVYKVEEIVAPKGYKLDKTPIYILFAKDIEGVDIFTLDGKEIEVIIEEEQYLYRIDFPNTPNPPGRRIPKTGD